MGTTYTTPYPNVVRTSSSEEQSPRAFFLDAWKRVYVSQRELQHHRHVIDDKSNYLAPALGASSLGGAMVLGNRIPPALLGTWPVFAAILGAATALAIFITRMPGYFRQEWPTVQCLYVEARDLNDKFTAHWQASNPQEPGHDDDYREFALKHYDEVVALQTKQSNARLCTSDVEQERYAMAFNPATMPRYYEYNEDIE